ncbi:MAG: hypothetical protein JSW58_11615 [Candidatus Latescibacterota bacterium]|nr:MAG: hypothetical protein JSW58_11615 [Candidatus Latescibacterota bacterium]
MVDERFITHRFKATRLATLVGTVLLAVFFFYAYIAKQVIRWDLFIVMCAMGVTKVLAMLYYRRTN